MTGFGKAQQKGKFGIISIEIRSFNHRFLEISQRLPFDMLDLEERIKEHVRKRTKRGRFNITLVLAGSETQDTKEVFVDKKLAAQYLRQIRGLRKSLGLKDEISLSQLISFPNVVTCKTSKPGSQNLWPFVKSGIDKALNALISMRRKEGKFLYDDLMKHIVSIERSIARIERSQPQALARFRRRLRERTNELTGGNRLDREKVESEVLIFTRSSDISEELARLKSHTINLKRALREEGEVGRKLDFIAQELHREINTIGAKSGLFKISKEVVEVKSRIDKIREQGQNVE